MKFKNYQLEEIAYYILIKLKEIIALTIIQLLNAKYSQKLNFKNSK